MTSSAQCGQAISIVSPSYPFWRLPLRIVKVQAVFAHGGEWNLVCGARSLNAVILNSTETHLFRNNVQIPQDNPQASLLTVLIRTTELSTE